MTKIDQSIPEAQWIMSKVKSKRSTPREIIIKLLKNEDSYEKNKGENQILSWRLSENY